MEMGINLLDYVPSELFILIPVIWIAGKFLKSLEVIPNNFIPLLLWGISCALAILYLLFVNHLYTSTASVVVGVTTGTLIAGVAVFGHQMFKQIKEKEEI